MKRILYVLVFALLLIGINISCKKNSLDVMHDNEVAARNKYIKDHDLAKYKDDSGIYFKSIVETTKDTSKLIKSKFKVMLQFKTFLIDSTLVNALTTEDTSGYTFDEFPFYVDLPNSTTSTLSVEKIAGMHIGLKKMHIGDRAFMVIPSELAFKAIDYTYAGIPSFSTLLVYVYAKKGYPSGTY